MNIRAGRRNVHIPRDGRRAGITDAAVTTSIHIDGTRARSWWGELVFHTIMHRPKKVITDKSVHIAGLVQEGVTRTHGGRRKTVYPSQEGDRPRETVQVVTLRDGNKVSGANAEIRTEQRRAREAVRSYLRSTER